LLKELSKGLMEKLEVDVKLILKFVDQILCNERIRALVVAVDYYCVWPAHDRTDRIWTSWVRSHYLAAVCQFTRNTPTTQNIMPISAPTANRSLKSAHAIRAVTGGVR
jgi:hypothetical protein